MDRLLFPKVFTKAIRYYADSEKIATDFTDKDNLIIKGNNLLALSSLINKYEGKIKLVYIDPPYNTGNDTFGYNDNFNRSTWLSFLKSRLEIAKKLLSDEGAIYVQLDYHQVHYARNRERCDHRLRRLQSESRFCHATLLRRIENRR